MRLTNKLIKKIRKTSLENEEVLNRFNIINNSEMAEMLGGGIKYTFDKEGILINHEQIEGDFDIIIAGHNQLTISGSLGLTTPDVTGPQSGATFNGNGVNEDVFKFLADNTDVEWAYCYKDGASGFLGTSNSEHRVELPSDLPEDYDYYMHNHSQNAKDTGLTQTQMDMFNAAPSEKDVEMLHNNGFLSGIIYSESDGKEYTYTESSKTQEEIAKENNWEIIKEDTGN